MKDDYTTNSHYLIHKFLFKLGDGRSYFLNLRVKVKKWNLRVKVKKWNLRVKVKLESESEKVKLESESEKVKLESESEKVKLESESEKVKLESESEKVKLESESEKVKLESESEKVKLESESEKVKLESESEKVKLESESEKVKLESESEKVKLESESETWEWKWKSETWEWKWNLRVKTWRPTMTKTALDSPFCAVTADSKSKWARDRTACFRGVGVRGVTSGRAGLVGPRAGGPAHPPGPCRYPCRSRNPADQKPSSGKQQKSRSERGKHGRKRESCSTYTILGLLFVQDDTYLFHAHRLYVTVSDKIRRWRIEWRGDICVHIRDNACSGMSPHPPVSREAADLAPHSWKTKQRL